MKGVVITADFDVSIREFSSPLYISVGATVDGYIEHVNPMGLKSPLCMIVNEEGLLRRLPLNPIASSLYGMEIHGQPIVGTAVIMKNGFTSEGPDIVGLSDEEAEQLYKLFSEIAETHKRAVRAVREE